ncbi:hypothetical protein GH714_017054 [Hevea brasiliensis]|uniref:F-box domain-containing protein n=1 Tax=Hevea brasiliensis TaxID=3981 RepID=A0A6A6N2D5_HEVBR|nr:hypothetical protein GH714_017054 [Hevea brasiliensis]
MHGLWTSSNQLGSGEQIQRVLNELAEVNSADIEKPRHDDKGAVTCNSIFLYAKCCKKLVGMFMLASIMKTQYITQKLHCKQSAGERSTVFRSSRCLQRVISASVILRCSSTMAERALHWRNGPGGNATCFLQGTLQLSGPILQIIGDGYPTQIPDFRKWLSLLMLWFEINGEISIQMLSPETSYAAYLVFKLTTSAYGFEGHPAEITVELAGSEKDKRSVFLVPVRGQKRQHQTLRRLTGLFNCSRVSGSQPSVPAGKSYGKYPKERVDGWLEIELGEFNSENGGDGKLKINLRVKGDHWKSGIIVQGIEIRPKGD